MGNFRIYGDNIIECERTARLVFGKLGIGNPQARLTDNLTLAYEMPHAGGNIILELLPGFNKSGRRRWERNVFDVLKEAGRVLDETPDVVITRVEDGKEEILLAIEFCSALQAETRPGKGAAARFPSGGQDARTYTPWIS